MGFLCQITPTSEILLNISHTLYATNANEIEKEKEKDKKTLLLNRHYGFQYRTKSCLATADRYVFAQP